MEIAEKWLLGKKAKEIELEVDWFWNIKIVKLLCFSEDDLAINPKEFPDVKIGDILEIYHPDEEESRYVWDQTK